MLWFSNGGRHYPPWSGRHVGVLGLEEVTAYLHYGLAESVETNSLSSRGHPTVIELSKHKSMAIRYLMAVQAIPRGFDAVADIELESDKAVLHARSGKQAVARLETSFLIVNARTQLVR